MALFGLIGRPKNDPGMNRDTAPSTPVDKNLITRLIGGIRGGFSANNQPGGVQQNGDQPFFPPGSPMEPMAQGSQGRAFDYPTAVNLTITPRTYEPLSFDTLRNIAEPSRGGWDLIRLAIETRKDQMSKLGFSIMARKLPNQELRPKTDQSAADVEQFLRKPDGRRPWESWVRMLLEEHLVIDAATLYRKTNLGGDTIGVELIDGATIRPIVDYDGRTPQVGTSYQQILKGLVTADYDDTELIYAPRNPRANKIYGFSPVEQIIGYVNIGLRRQVSQLGYFTEGNIPDALWAVPADWTTSQIAEYQIYWDSMMQSVEGRRKMKFMPGGGQIQMTRSDNGLTDTFDEWLARIVAYCFSLPPTPFVRDTNRATAESAYDSALDEGLQPLMSWIKNIIDRIIAEWLGAPDLEMVWDEVRPADPEDEMAADLQLVQRGVIGIDDMRAKRGMDPTGLPLIVYGLGPMGFMSVEAMKRAIAQGLDLTGPVQPGMPGGDLSAMGSGAQGDPLSGLPPDLLDALGIGSGDTGAAGSPAGNTDGSSSLSGGIAQVGTQSASGGAVPIHQHPEVQSALADGDRYMATTAKKPLGRGRSKVPSTTMRP